MATVFRRVKETVDGKTKWVRVRDPKDKRPGTWFLAFCRDGKQIQMKTEATSKTEALQLLEKERSDNVKAKLMGVQAVSINMTYSQFVQETFMPHVEQTRRANTYKMYGQLARATEAALGKLKLREIRRGHIQQYITDRKLNGKTWKNKPLRPATINREVGFIKSVFYDALGRELVERNPAARIEMLDEKNKRERTMTPAEEKKILAESPAWLLPMLDVAVLAGLRRGEILGLKWKEHAGREDHYVDLQKNVIHISAEAKDGDARDVPITPKLRTVLAGLSRGIKDGRAVAWVFPDPETNDAMAAHLLSHTFERAVRRAKITDLHLHDLRRTFASRLIDRGVSLPKVAALLGHSGTYVTERYAHASDKGLEEAVALLSRAANT